MKMSEAKRYIDEGWQYHWGHRSLSCRWETLQTLSPFDPSHQDSLWNESYSIFIIALLYFIFFWSDKNDQFVLPLFRVINCVLFVYPSMVYYYIFIWIILYSFWLVCCCSNELIPECFFPLMLRLLWLMLHLRWFFFVVLKLKDNIVWNIIFCTSQPFFMNRRSVTQSKIDSTVYFFHWYLFIGFVFMSFCFMMSIAYISWSNRTQKIEGSSLSLAFLLFYKSTFTIGVL